MASHPTLGTTATDDGLGSILGVLADAVVVLDSHGCLLWANRAAERLFDVSIESALGMSGLELVHPDDLELAGLSLESVQGKVAGSPIELRVKSGEGWRLVEIIGSATSYAGQTAIALCIRDLTERRRWEVAGDEVAAFRSLIQNAATITMLVGADGELRSASGALTRLLGHDPEKTESRLLNELVWPDDRAAVTHALSAARSSEDYGRSGPVHVEARFLRRSGGQPVPLALTIVNLLEDPTIEGFVVSAHDISDRRAAEERVRSALSVLNATFDSTADGILVVDLDGTITSHNRRFAEMWRIPEHVLTSGDSSTAIELALGQLSDPSIFLDRITEARGQLRLECDVTLEFLDGRVFECNCRPQRIGESIVGRVWSFHDVTERKRLEDDLSHQAFHDSLTGLANQALFFDRLEHAVHRTRRSADDIAVLFMDLDSFKTVNDGLGHAAGDRLLVEIGRRVERCVRAGDTAARLGGDEFAVLLENLAGPDQPLAVAGRIITAIEQPMILDGKEVTPSLSIGIAYSGAAADAEQLLRNADLAMYTAKSRGRGQFAVFESSMHTAAMDRLELEADLRHGLKRGELGVVYQPIVELRTGRVLTVEALARWKHPRRGWISPAVFIPLAEETGVINELGDYVLRTATADLDTWQSILGPDTTMSLSVNLSPSQLLSPMLVPKIAALISEHRLAPGQLILEITEGAMMMDAGVAQHTARALKGLGARLAVDDFGTGYSSLTHLQQFPIDIVKIDRSFVQLVDQAPEDAALAKAIVRLAQTLHLTVVAEGVETPGQAAELQRLGCDLAQGFLLARPCDRSVIIELLSGAANVTWPHSSDVLDYAVRSS
jgi:diguanylate cyclase (GGDEF)-like protein/PAS domain S-box-containing protein